MNHKFLFNYDVATINLPKTKEELKELLTEVYSEGYHDGYDNGLNEAESFKYKWKTTKAGTLD